MVQVSPATTPPPSSIAQALTAAGASALPLDAVAATNPVTTVKAAWRLANSSVAPSLPAT